MEMSNRYLIMVNNVEEAHKLLKVLKENSDIKWRSGEQLGDKDKLNCTWWDENEEIYLVIKGNTIFWLDEKEYFIAPDDFLLYDLYDVDGFIDKIVNKMEKKLEIKNLGIVASDDKYGEKLLSFLDEFTGVKFNSGDNLISKDIAEQIKELKEKYPKDNLVFVVINSRMYVDIYIKDRLQMYKSAIGGEIYSSVREFLLSKDEWIKE